MIDRDLLEILACPDTRQSLAMAAEDLLAVLNERIAAGTVETVGGAAVTEPLTEGLVRKDGQIVYPVRDGIPVLLVDEGLPVEPASA